MMRNFKTGNKWIDLLIGIALAVAGLAGVGFVLYRLSESKLKKLAKIMRTRPGSANTNDWQALANMAQWLRVLKENEAADVPFTPADKTFIVQCSKDFMVRGWSVLALATHGDRDLTD